MSRATFSSNLEIRVARAEAERRLLEVYAAVMDLMAALPGSVVEGQATALAKGAKVNDRTLDGVLSTTSANNLRPTMVRGHVILADLSNVPHTEDGQPILDFEAETYTEVTCYMDDDPCALTVNVYSPVESTSSVLGARIARVLERIPQPSAPPMPPPAGIPATNGAVDGKTSMNEPGRLLRSARWLGRHALIILSGILITVVGGWILVSCQPPWVP